MVVLCTLMVRRTGVQGVLVTQDSCPFVPHPLKSLHLTHIPLTAPVMFPLDWFFLLQLFAPYLAMQEAQQGPSACLLLRTEGL